MFLAGKDYLKAALMVSALFLGLVMLGPSAGWAAEVSANPKSGIYHNVRCRHFGCKSCTVTFPNGEAARKAGYRACRKCGG